MISTIPLDFHNTIVKILFRLCLLTFALSIEGSVSRPVFRTWLALNLSMFHKRLILCRTDKSTCVGARVLLVKPLAGWQALEGDYYAYLDGTD